MSDPGALEFTGERVIPGRVDPNLFNEHLARYRFAARFAAGAHVLDAGCGSGYGTAELASAASVTAMDISAEATAWAHRTFVRAGVEFLQGDCAALPFADASFDLVLAFEVIEHLERWPRLLTEARRVLRPTGILLVSTPNKAWYAESRAAAGPNPFHVREFERPEFETILTDAFTHVRLWSQNHVEGIAFVSGAGALVPGSPACGLLDAPGDAAPEHAHFFLAACSQSPIAQASPFAWLPGTGNLLRERQRHIALLESELASKDAWLGEARESHARLQRSHEQTLAELHHSNNWAARLNAELATARDVIGCLEREAAERLAWIQDREAHIVALAGQIARLESEAGERLAWLGERDAHVIELGGQIARLQSEADERLRWINDREAHIADLEGQTSRGRAEIDKLQRENLERTHWALGLDKELENARSHLRHLESYSQRLQKDSQKLQALESTRWVRLARKLGLISRTPA